MLRDSYWHCNVLVRVYVSGEGGMWTTNVFNPDDTTLLCLSVVLPLFAMVVVLVVLTGLQ